MRTKNNASGFTLIELTLAMAFIGMLLIATVVTIMQVTNQYSKGITVKLINQAGRDLGDAIRRDAVNVAAIANPIVQPDSTHNGSLGRLCLGAYTYVWSSPEALQGEGGLVATAYSDSGTPGKQIVLARVADSGGSLCQADASGHYSTDIKQADSTEMLPNDKGDYAIHQVGIQTVPASGAAAGTKLYDIQYTIGTNQQGTIDTTAKCEPPNKNTNNFNFCAINNFEIMVQAGYEQ